MKPCQSHLARPVSHSDHHGSASHARCATLIILAFWLVSGFVFSLRHQAYSLLDQFVTMHSEFTLPEQLSKFYLFAIILIGVISYCQSSTPAMIKLNIAFMLLGLVLYMAESNQLKEESQPLFGLLFGGGLIWFLYRTRKWLSLLFILLGFTAIAAAALLDVAGEHASIMNLWPALFRLLEHSIQEEHLEFFGTGSLCLAAILSNRIYLGNFLRVNWPGALAMLVFAGLLTSGNGLIHQQYNPEQPRHAAALVIMLIGFLGLVGTNKWMIKDDCKLRLGRESHFILLLFIFFIILPSSFGRERITTSLLVWLPMLIFTTIALWRQHPLYPAGEQLAGDSLPPQEGVVRIEKISNSPSAPDTRSKPG